MNGLRYTLVKINRYYLKTYKTCIIHIHIIVYSCEIHINETNKAHIINSSVRGYAVMRVRAAGMKRK